MSETLFSYALFVIGAIAWAGVFYRNRHIPPEENIARAGGKLRFYLITLLVLVAIARGLAVPLDGFLLFGLDIGDVMRGMLSAVVIITGYAFWFMGPPAGMAPR